jgi:hypothetical protein
MEAVAAHQGLIRVEECEEIDEPRLLRSKVNDLCVQIVNFAWSG